MPRPPQRRVTVTVTVTVVILAQLGESEGNLGTEAACLDVGVARAQECLHGAQHRAPPHLAATISAAIVTTAVQEQVAHLGAVAEGTCQLAHAVTLRAPGDDASRHGPRAGQHAVAPAQYIPAHAAPQHHEALGHEPPHFPRLQRHRARRHASHHAAAAVAAAANAKAQGGLLGRVGVHTTSIDDQVQRVRTQRPVRLHPDTDSGTQRRRLQAVVASSGAGVDQDEEGPGRRLRVGVRHFSVLRHV